MKHTPTIFYNSSCTDVKFDDYLLLGGGSDINPNIYGSVNHGQCQSPDNRRDERNLSAIREYTAAGKPVIGVCRGLQILDAFNGGKLIQHTSGHSSLVPVIVDTKTHNALRFDNCRSCHHQVVNPEQTKGEIIGYSSYRYFAHDPDVNGERYSVPQIVYWPGCKHLGVQFHPEWHGEQHSMNKFLRKLIKDLLGLENVL